MINKSLLYLVFIFLVSCYSDEKNTVRQLPKKKNNYKICAFGDSGKNSREQALIAKNLINENCDEIRHLGDVIYPSGITDRDDPNFYSHFYNHYKPLIEKNVPFYISLGNHDYKKNPLAWLEVAKNIH